MSSELRSPLSEAGSPSVIAVHEHVRDELGQTSAEQDVALLLGGHVLVGDRFAGDPTDGFDQLGVAPGLVGRRARRPCPRGRCR
ncbi:hypothetical protein [Lentzea aerocolonigenes]|uniref:hypothetical protein n=1 Tax=Lentzea aerocolonigenes TaxID=68170 RepID=UPI0012DCB532|nr:hypothetical protein [Lentzea aerocolonigenes]